MTTDVHETTVAIEKISIAVNRSHINKLPNGDPRWGKFNDSFENVILTLDELIAEIKAGHAITSPHEHSRHLLGKNKDGSDKYSAYRHSLNFRKSWHLGGDHDALSIDAALENPFVSQFAAILHTTASHKADDPRCRSLYILDSPIRTRDHYTKAASALTWHFGKVADSSCKDAARLFFGAKGCEVRKLGNILPLSVVNSLIDEWEAWGAAEQRGRSDYNFDGAAPDIQEVRQMLRFVPKDGGYHDHWLKILMAVSDSYPGAEGIALCEEWSPGYPGEIERKFKSFKRGGKRVTIASLVKMAKDNGYQPPRKSRTDKTRTVAIDAIPEPPTAHVNGEHPAEQASEKVGRATAIRDAIAAMGYTFRLNLVRERIERGDGSVLHDGEQASIIAALFDRGLSNKQLMLDVMLAEAWTHSYDPLKDFLDSLEWDGQDHIRKLSYYFEDAHPLIEYPDGSKATVFYAWLRRWLTGAAGKVVARVQNPMLVLVSEQGIGKSEFAKWLCSPMPDYFVENAINPEAVDHQRWAAGNFIWEVGELGATTRKADVEALKAFITRHEHSFRVPYAKYEVHKPARASFLGTVNPDNAGFLTDPTGNRRFLTVAVTAINWHGYIADVDVRQVWAQAYALYRQDTNAWKLDETETVIRDGINIEFNIDDPVRDAILALFYVIPNAVSGDGVSFTSSADLVFHIGTRVRAVNTKSLQMDVSRAMKRLNVTKDKRDNVNGYFGVSKRPVTSFQPSNHLPTSND
jgi:hypothetical protein